MRKEETTASGLRVVREVHSEVVKAAPKKRPEQEIRRCFGRSKKANGIEAITEVNLGGPKSKLDPEERKERRMDNKTLRKLRGKTRGRKKHGRP